jgi:hypothetical protein
MAKLTFSLDDGTVRILRQIAQRTGKAQSLVVREAIVEYAAKEETLPEGERKRRLAILHALAAQPPTRTSTSVDRELRALRRTRRTGWARKSD